MKVDRSAFLYMDPTGTGAFGQCGTCRMRVKHGDRMTCSLHGEDFSIEADDSCGLYVHGPYDPTEKQHESADVVPGESGFVSREVRCENCKFYDPDEGDCELFEMLNKTRPDVFALDTKVAARGCCNAQLPREGARVGEMFESLT